MIGQRFGRLIVTAQAERKNGYVMWECTCDCGGTIVVRTGNLKYAITSSCGCLRRENTANLRRTHGRSKSSIHNTWCLMKERCANQEDNYYGGRGITVCERWLHSFENFLADMGERPFPGAQIDRIDNSKGYSPDNCRWSTRKENGRNKRNNVILTLKGESLTMIEWSEKLNIGIGLLKSRRRLKWSDEDILTKPVDHTAGRFVKGQKCNRKTNNAS